MIEFVFITYTIHSLQERNTEIPIIDIDDSNLDEFDELTMEELRSLLDNFKNLSKSEQMDLVQYMRKLETTDPEKVKKLKDTTVTSDKPVERYSKKRLTGLKKIISIFWPKQLVNPRQAFTALHIVLE